MFQLILSIGVPISRSLPALASTGIQQVALFPAPGAVACRPLVGGLSFGGRPLAWAEPVISFMPIIFIFIDGRPDSKLG